MVSISSIFRGSKNVKIFKICAGNGYFFVCSSSFSKNKSKGYILDQLVKISDIAVVGKVVSAKCVRPSGDVVPFDQPCNGKAGAFNHNRYVFEIEVSAVLMSDRKIEIPSNLKFDHNADRHWGAKQPKHKQLGKEYIVFLKNVDRIRNRLMTTLNSQSFIDPKRLEETLKLVTIYKPKSL